jgi:hypothetical protein
LLRPKRACEARSCALPLSYTSLRPRRDSNSRHQGWSITPRHTGSTPLCPLPWNRPPDAHAMTPAEIARRGAATASAMNGRDSGTRTHDLLAPDQACFLCATSRIGNGDYGRGPAGAGGSAASGPTRAGWNRAVRDGRALRTRDSRTLTGMHSAAARGSSGACRPPRRRARTPRSCRPGSGRACTSHTFRHIRWPRVADGAYGSRSCA